MFNFLSTVLASGFPQLTQILTVGSFRFLHLCSDYGSKWKYEYCILRKVGQLQRQCHETLSAEMTFPKAIQKQIAFLSVHFPLREIRER